MKGRGQRVQWKKEQKEGHKLIVEECLCYETTKKGRRYGMKLERGEGGEGVRREEDERGEELTLKDRVVTEGKKERK